MNGNNKLNLTTQDELYLIDIPRVVYFQADDHYSYVYYNTEVHLQLPFSLGTIEAAIKQTHEAGASLVRMGRKYIVNTDRIIRVSSIQCKLYLCDEQGKTHTLSLSKPIIRDLIGNKSRTKDDCKEMLE